MKKEDIDVVLAGGLYTKRKQPIFYARLNGTNKIAFYDGDRNIDGYVIVSDHPEEYSEEELGRRVVMLYKNYSSSYLSDFSKNEKLNKTAKEFLALAREMDADHYKVWLSSVAA